MRLGTDPEVLLVDKTGKHISAIGYINADKWHPMQIEGMEDGFTLQEDNVTLEYGIPPASTAQEFIRSINRVMQRSKDWIPNLDFSKLSCVTFDEDQMAHPLAHVFGCEPDFCAWTNTTNPSPQAPHPYQRTAGGHIHVETDQDPKLVIKNMDVFLGVPSTLMDNHPASRKRREMYGKRGAYRQKSYGVEYRTLSNFWIFTPELIQWVWNQTELALKNPLGIDVLNSLDARIEQAINQGDQGVAHELCDEFGIEVI